MAVLDLHHVEEIGHLLKAAKDCCTLDVQIQVFDLNHTDRLLGVIRLEEDTYVFMPAPS